MSARRAVRQENVVPSLLRFLGKDCYRHLGQGKQRWAAARSLFEQSEFDKGRSNQASLLLSLVPVQSLNEAQERGDDILLPSCPGVQTPKIHSLTSSSAPQSSDKASQVLLSSLPPRR